MEEHNTLHKEGLTPIKVVVVGQVDDGKSTLIGRLLYETGSLSENKIKDLKDISARRNMPLEWSYLLDAFQVERNQAITIDISHVHLKTEVRSVLIIDAPGHIEFIKNMLSGSAQADAAFLLVDVNEGIREQTRRHAFLLNFLGIQQVAILINKMDLCSYSEVRFKKLSSMVVEYLKTVGLCPNFVIPISARHGDNLKNRSSNMPWYQGPTVLEIINNGFIHNTLSKKSLRFPIQDIYKFDEKRILVGKLVSGEMRVNEIICISGSNQKAKINSIEVWNAAPKSDAKLGESIGIILDKPIFVERGDILCDPDHLPMLTNKFQATIFWLDDVPLIPDKIYKLHLTTAETTAQVKIINQVINLETLEKSKATRLEKNQCGEVIFQTQNFLSIDDYHSIPAMGRFVLKEDHDIVGAGMIFKNNCEDLREKINNTNLHVVKHNISYKHRELKNGHKGGILWFTGLSGSGKSTLAMLLEKYLFLKGYQVFVLDGDNIRTGLNANLGFSQIDRKENIRRVGEVASLFSEAGFVCITAFISPYKEDRKRVRETILNGNFHEIYLKAPLEICEARDPKGLYKKARCGKIMDFTGISAPYEVPDNPELIIDTVNFEISDCVKKIMNYIKDHFYIKDKNAFLNNKQPISILEEEPCA